MFVPHQDSREFQTEIVRRITVAGIRLEDRLSIDHCPASLATLLVDFCKMLKKGFGDDRLWQERLESMIVQQVGECL